MEKKVNILEPKISERVYGEIYSKADILYFLLDSNGHQILSCNVTAQEKLGYEKKELLGIDFFDIFSKSERGELEKIISTCLIRGYVKNAEKSLCSKTRKCIKCKINGLTEFDDNGNPLGIRFYIRDISNIIISEKQKYLSLKIMKIIQEKELSKGAMREVLSEIQEIMESDGIGISFRRKNGKNNIIGNWKNEENSIDLGDYNYRKWTYEIWNRIYIACCDSKACYSTSGGSIWVDSLSDLILESQHSNTEDYLASLAEYESLIMIPIVVKETTSGYFVMAHTEISKWIEDDIKFLEDIIPIFSSTGEEKIQDSFSLKDKYAPLMNTSILGILFVKDGQIQFTNSWVEEFTGFSKTELKGKSILDLIVPEYRDVILALSQQNNCEVAVNTKKGDYRWIECTFTTTSIKGKSENLWYWINKEDKLRLQEHLLQARKMESLGMLAGGIVHEFKNLLAGIQGYGSLLSEDIPPESPYFEDVHQITKITEQATELASRLLAYAQGGTCIVSELDINQLIKEVASMVSKNIEKNIVMRAELDPKLMKIRADASQIQHIILQVVLNARDAMSNGGKIIFRTQNLFLDKNDAWLRLGGKPGPYVQITVSDTGSGMSCDVRKQIFEPHFTTKGQTAGKGLGLSMVQEIVDKHGGFISVFSEKDKGTVFKMHLPASEKRTPQSQTFSRERLPLGKETILLVDNEKVFRETARKMLTRYGYKVMSVESSSEAISLYKRYTNRIDLIVIDLTIPSIEVNKVLEWFKKLNPKVKIVVTTNLEEKGIVEGELQTSIAGFIQKPFQVRPFLRKVRAVLNA